MSDSIVIQWIKALRTQLNNLTSKVDNIIVPVAGPSTPVAPGTSGLAVYAADNDILSRDKAVTPAGLQSLLNLSAGTNVGDVIDFKTSGSYLFPSGYKYVVQIVLFGGGGGGGQGRCQLISNVFSGGGGGAGGCNTRMMIINGPQQINVVIGAGGTGEVAVLGYPHAMGMGGGYSAITFPGLGDKAIYAGGGQGTVSYAGGQGGSVYPLKGGNYSGYGDTGGSVSGLPAYLAHPDVTPIGSSKGRSGAVYTFPNTVVIPYPLVGGLGGICMDIDYNPGYAAGGQGGTITSQVNNTVTAGASGKPGYCHITILSRIKI